MEILAGDNLSARAMPRAGKPESRENLSIDGERKSIGLVGSERDGRQICLIKKIVVMFRGLANQLLSSSHYQWSNGYKKKRKEPITNLLKNISTRRQSLMEVSWIAGLSLRDRRPILLRSLRAYEFIFNLNRPLSFRVVNNLLRLQRPSEDIPTSPNPKKEEHTNSMKNSWPCYNNTLKIPDVC